MHILHRLVPCSISNSTPGIALSQKIRGDSGIGCNPSSNLGFQGINPSFTFPRGLLGQPGPSCPLPAPLQGQTEGGGFKRKEVVPCFAVPLESAPSPGSGSCSRPLFPFPGAELHTKAALGAWITSQARQSRGLLRFNGIQRQHSRTKPPLPSCNDPCVSKEISSP